MSSFASDVISVGSFGLIDGGDLTGENAADAAKQASQTQAHAIDKGIELTRETRDLARNDLSPFLNFGSGQINPLSEMLTPQGQADYLSTNPLFQSSLDSINRATMSNQAARGKLGSGDTLKALQNNFNANAMPYISNQQNALFNAVNMGQSSAAGQANTALTSGANMSNMLGQQGDVRAAGIVGQQGAGQAAFNNLLSFGGQIGGGMLAACDIRVKKDIKKVGVLDNGLNIYTFKYIGEDKVNIGVMAQEVEKVNPDAVQEINGIKHVNYGKVA